MAGKNLPREVERNHRLSRTATPPSTRTKPPVDDIKFTSVNRIPPRADSAPRPPPSSRARRRFALAGQDLAAPQTKQLLLQLAADAEGHPDNVAPAIYGGFQVSINTGLSGMRKWVTQAIKLPKGMQAILFIPEFESLTAETRAALPKEIPVSDAVFNISRAAMLINSFATDNFEALRYACEDVIHQPIRGAAFPLKPLIDAALGKGAHGAFLSGAGPTVLHTGGHGSDVDADTMATFLAVEVADAMLAAAKDGCEGRAVISAPSTAGVRCKKEEALLRRMGKTSGSVLSRATDGTGGTFGGDEWSAVGDDDDDDDEEEAALFGGVHARGEWSRALFAGHSTCQRLHFLRALW